MKNGLESGGFGVVFANSNVLFHTAFINGINMELKHIPFARCDRMVEVVTKSRKWFYAGERSEGVIQLQWGLIDVGYALPKSTVKNNGNPDGVYGAECIAAIRDYQTKKPGLTVDGVAGRNTVLRLDEQLALAAPPPPPKMPTHIVPILTKGQRYKVGTKGPHNPVDVGAGPWNSRYKVEGMRTIKYAIMAALWSGNSRIRSETGPNAMKHMLHYFGNTGDELIIDVFRLLHDVPRTRDRYREEVQQMRDFAETLPLGTHTIVSEKVEYDGIPKAASSDWYFAINNYQRWGEARVTITEDASGAREYAAYFEYHIYDPYTWDGGKSVKIAGYTVTDDILGEFHRQGLAKQFIQRGKLVRNLSWTANGPTKGM